MARQYKSAGVLSLRTLGFSFWTLVLLSRSWTGSKARCCPTQATTLCGTTLEIGLTYMVNEAVMFDSMEYSLSKRGAVPGPEQDCQS